MVSNEKEVRLGVSTSFGRHCWVVEVGGVKWVVVGTVIAGGGAEEEVGGAELGVTLKLCGYAAPLSETGLGERAMGDIFAV